MFLTVKRDDVILVDVDKVFGDAEQTVIPVAPPAVIEPHHGRQPFNDDPRLRWSASVTTTLGSNSTGLATRDANGHLGVNLTIPLMARYRVEEIDIGFYTGHNTADSRSFIYNVFVSDDGENWTKAALTGDVTAVSFRNDTAIGTSASNPVIAYMAPPTINMGSNDYNYHPTPTTVRLVTPVEANYIKIQGYGFATGTQGTVGNANPTMSANQWFVVNRLEFYGAFISNHMAVISVTLDTNSTTMFIGDTKTLIADVQPQNAFNKKISWNSDNPAVASVSDSGVVTAVSTGSANISVTSIDGDISDVCYVQVIAGTSVTGVTLNKSAATITIGGTETLVATIAPANATNKNLIWSSSTAAIAEVDSDGKVTAKAAGTATITVRTAQGSFTATCTVTVPSNDSGGGTGWSAPVAGHGLATHATYGVDYASNQGVVGVSQAKKTGGFTDGLTSEIRTNATTLMPVNAADTLANIFNNPGISTSTTAATMTGGTSGLRVRPNGAQATPRYIILNYSSVPNMPNGVRFNRILFRHTANTNVNILIYQIQISSNSTNGIDGTWTTVHTETGTTTSLTSATNNLVMPQTYETKWVRLAITEGYSAVAPIGPSTSFRADIWALQIYCDPTHPAGTSIATDGGGASVTISNGDVTGAVGTALTAPISFDIELTGDTFATSVVNSMDISSWFNLPTGLSAAVKTLTAADKIEVEISGTPLSASTSGIVVSIPASALATSTSAVRADVNSNAKFDIMSVKYTIGATINPAVGGIVAGDGLYNPNAAVVLTAASNKHYDFDGWYNAGSQVSTANPYTFTAAADITLEARFKLTEYTISVTPEPSTSGSVTGDGSYTALTPVTLTAVINPQNDFDGWYDTATGELITNVNPYNFTAVENLTLEARFIPFRDLTGVPAPSPITGVVNGAPKTAAGLGLPSIVTVNTDGTPSTFNASIIWDVAASSYDPSVKTAQTFTVDGTFTLPLYIINTTSIPLTVSISVTVDAANLVSITAPTAITGLTNGTAKIEAALGLPSTVVMVTNGTPANVNANVTWDVAASSYDPSVKTAQTFTVNGTASLPTGILNTNTVSLDVSISVTVNAVTTITFQASQVGGTSNTIDSTDIQITFDHTVTGLTANDITIADGTGSAVKGALSGNGQVYTIALSSVTVQGNVNVSIADWSGFEVTSPPQTVQVYKQRTDAQTPVITSITPHSATVTTGNAITITVHAEVDDGGVLTYQWYRNAANSNSGGALIVGAEADSYSPPTDSIGTYYYYVIVKNTNNAMPGIKTAETVSDVVTLVVNNLVNAEIPAITLQPQHDVSITVGAPYSLTVTASVSDGGMLSYQWYRNNTNSDSGGTAISSATDNSYAVPTGTAGIYYYYVEVTNTIADNLDGGVKSATETSNTATVTVNTLVNAAIPVITMEPQSETVTVGTPYSLTVAASVSDGGILSYQWYSNNTNSNSGGTAISSATDNSYAVPTGTAGIYYYYVEVTNTNSSVSGTKTAVSTSDTATVTVNTLVNAAIPSITMQPQSETVTVGTSYTLTVSASVSDGGTLSYQWYRNTSPTDIGGTAISGATDNSYTVPTGTAGTSYYYVVVTNTIPNNGDGGVKTAHTASNAVTITVNLLVNAAIPSIAIQPQSGSVTAGTSYTLSVAATVTDGGTLSYQWYRNTSPTDIGGTAISGATSATYAVPTSTAGTYYYYVVVTNTIPNNGDGGVKTAHTASNAVTVTVTAVTYVTYTITASATPAAGGTTAGGGTYNANETVTLAATPNANYVFDGWYEGGTRVSPNRIYTFPATADRTLEAWFTYAPPVTNYTITVSSDGNGTVWGSGTYVSGTQVTVTALPYAGHSFDGWYENGSWVSSSSSYTITVTSNRSLQARFIYEETTYEPDPEPEPEQPPPPPVVIPPPPEPVTPPTTTTPPTTSETETIPSITAEAAPVDEKTAEEVKKAVENLDGKLPSGITAETVGDPIKVEVEGKEGEKSLVTIVMPKDADTSSITTMAVLNDDGTLTPVPTRIDEDGKVHVLVSGDVTLVPLHVEASFIDISGHTQQVQDDINLAASMMIVNGRGEGIFDPSTEVTIQEAATMFLRTLGVPVEFATAMETAVEHDLVTADAVAEAPMKRIDAAEMIVNALEDVGIHRSMTLEEATVILSEFTDLAGLSAEQMIALAITVELGIFRGAGGGLMNPNAILERSHMASLSVRMQDVIFGLSN